MSFHRPIITLNWSQIVLHSNNVFEFSTIEPLRKQLNEIELEMNETKGENDAGKFEQKKNIYRFDYFRKTFNHDSTTRYSRRIFTTSWSNVICK